MKITQLKMKLSFGCTPSDNLSYRLYSCLLQRIGSDYADYLHSGEAFAISQYLVAARGMWYVSLFGDEAAEHFLPAFEEKQFDLQACGIATVLSTEANEFETIIGAGSATRTERELSFITPTSFKCAGKYETAPTAEHIIASLIQKWDRCETGILSEELSREITAKQRITSQKIKACTFPLKGTRIPSFTGNATLHAELTGRRLAIWNSLIDFAQFSGIGIKTTLGMGGVESV